MTRADYDRIDAVNWSTLRHMGKSPAHYRFFLDNPPEATAAMVLGRAVHAAVLEPATFTESFLLWQGGRRAGKEWEAFRAAAEGKDILTQDEFSRCLALQTAVRTDPVAAEYLRGGSAEVAMEWTDPVFGIACKGLVDYVAPGLIVDLKTTKSGSPSGFGREAYLYQYHCQMAHYTQGYAALHGGEIPRVVLIAVEKDGPLVVTCYEMPADVLRMGRETVDALLQTLKDCRASGQYHGYACGTMQLQLPKWAMPSEESPGDEEW